MRRTGGFVQSREALIGAVSSAEDDRYRELVERKKTRGAGRVGADPASLPRRARCRASEGYEKRQQGAAHRERPEGSTRGSVADLIRVPDERWRRPGGKNARRRGADHRLRHRGSILRRRCRVCATRRPAWYGRSLSTASPLLPADAASRTWAAAQWRRWLRRNLAVKRCTAICSTASPCVENTAEALARSRGRGRSDAASWAVTASC